MSGFEKDKKNTKDKKKEVFADDGRTIYDMSNLPPRTGAKKKTEGVEVTKKEKRAIIKAAFESYAPTVLIIILCFSAIAFLLWLWLK